jgi:hypothetical protein
MPINAKIGGSWSNGTPFIKTSNSWSTAKQVFAKVNGTWQTVYTSSISDNFNRANSSDLGNVPDTDTVWTKRSGSWSISNNKVATSTSAANHPFIDVEFSTQNVLVGANINATGTSQASGKYGAGIAFWIVDSANWWAAYNDVVTTGTIVYTCASTFNGKPLQSGQGTATCVYDYAATATTTPGSEFCSSGTGPVASFARYNTSTGTTDQVKYNVCITASQVGGRVTSPLSCPTYSGFKFYRPIGSGNDCYTSFDSISPSTTSPTTTYSCPSGGTLSGTTCLMNNSATQSTTYSYSHKVKLINSIAGSIATINTYTVNDNTWIPANISVSTSNNTITLNAYQNDDNTGSSWNQVYTASSPNRGTKHGLIVAPKSDAIVSQATELDNFTLSAV